MRRTARRAGLIVGWLLTPVAAWAASFLVGWLGAVAGARHPAAVGALAWLGGGSLVGAIGGTVAWILVMRMAERAGNEPPEDGEENDR